MRSTTILCIMVILSMGIVGAEASLFPFESRHFEGCVPEVTQPQLVLSCDGDMLTIENVGTAPSTEFQGAAIMICDEVIGRMPYSIIYPDPFILTKGVNTLQTTKITVKLSRTPQSGEKICLAGSCGAILSKVVA